MDRAGAELGVNLAVSLHAVRDELRDELVPLNRKYPIAELIAACRRYPGASNARRITFEYVMLKGVNDSEADARELVRLIAGHAGEGEPDPVQSVARQRVRDQQRRRRSSGSRGSSRTRGLPRRCARRAGATSWRRAGSCGRRAGGGGMAWVALPQERNQADTEFHRVRTEFHRGRQ